MFGKMILHKYILVLCLLSLCSCQNTERSSELALQLRIHIHALQSDWVDTDQVRVSLHDHYGQSIDLNHHEYQTELDGLVWQIKSTLTGNLSIRVRFDHMFETQKLKEVFKPLTLEFNPHPALDKQQHILLYQGDEYRQHIVDIRLQALSFLTVALEDSVGQRVDTESGVTESSTEIKVPINQLTEEEKRSQAWIQALGFSDQLWWDYHTWSEEGVSDSNEGASEIAAQNEAQIILQKAWLILSQEDPWAVDLIQSYAGSQDLDTAWYPWLLVSLLNHQPSLNLIDETGLAEAGFDEVVDQQPLTDPVVNLPLTWGALLYETLVSTLNGQHLSLLSLHMLAQVYCSPWMSTSLTRQRCASNFKGIYIEAPIEQFIDTEAASDNPSLTAHSMRSVFNARIISLDGSKILNPELTLLDPWHHELSLESLEINTESVTLSETHTQFQLEQFPAQSIHFSFETQALNRPRFLVALSAINEMNAQQIEEFLVEYETSQTAEIKGIVSLLKSINSDLFQAEKIVATPLSESLFPPYNQNQWTAAIDSEGQFSLRINGYQGPLWLATELSTGEQLWLINQMNDHEVINYLTVSLSPLSTFYAWLSLSFFDWLHANQEADSSSNFELNFEQNMEQSRQSSGQIHNEQEGHKLSQFYHYIDQQGTWLSTYESVQHISDLAHRVSSSALRQFQDEQLIALGKAHQQSIGCFKSLIQFEPSRHAELSTLWQLGTPSFAERLQSLLTSSYVDQTSEVLNTDLDAHPLLALWQSFVLGACLFKDLTTDTEGVLTQTDLIANDVDPKHLALQQALHQGSEVGHIFSDFGSELSLFHGIWLHDGTSWLTTSFTRMSLSIKSIQGLVSVLLEQADHNQELSVDLLNVDLSNTEAPLRTSESLWSFDCPWTWTHHLQTRRNQVGMHPRAGWYWGQGQWIGMDTDQVRELFTVNERAETFKAWRWGQVNQSLDTYPLPLRCQLDIDWSNLADMESTIEQQDQDLKLKINAEVWRSHQLEESQGVSSNTEFVSRELEFKLYKTAPEYALRLVTPEIHEITDENDINSHIYSSWQRYTESPQPHWILRQATLPNDSQLPSKLKLHLSASKALVCEINDDLDRLNLARQLGDYILPLPVYQAPVPRIDQNNRSFELHQIKASSQVYEWKRWARKEGGQIFHSQFKGSKDYEIDVELPREMTGHKSLWLRCEDALGYSTIKAVSFSVDTQAPRIIEAQISGVNEALLQADSQSELSHQNLGQSQRIVDVLNQDPEQVIYWSRWTSHWQDCPTNCPQEALNELNLEFTAQDQEWNADELKAKLEADLYILDEEEQRLNEIQLTSDQVYLDEYGTARFNLYTLLNHVDWAQFAPLPEHDFRMHIDLIVSDPSGHESHLEFELGLESMIPMVSVQIEPNLSPVHRLIAQGDFRASLNENYGRLNLHNPHDIPIKVTLNPPGISLGFDLITRDSGLPILSSRLFQSCLYNETFQVSQELRLINYQVASDQSITGDCISLGPAVVSPQHFNYGPNDWHQSLDRELSFVLNPQSQISIDLPRFNPTLSATINQLVQSPNVSPSESYPSPYQAKSFTEPSIFADGSSFCEACPVQFLLGHRIISLNSFSYEPSLSEDALEHYQYLASRYAARLNRQHWSISVSSTDGSTRGSLFPLFLTESASFRFE